MGGIAKGVSRADVYNFVKDQTGRFLPLRIVLKGDCAELLFVKPSTVGGCLEHLKGEKLKGKVVTLGIGLMSQRGLKNSKYSGYGVNVILYCKKEGMTQQDVADHLKAFAGMESAPTGISVEGGCAKIQLASRKDTRLLMDNVCGTEMQGHTCWVEVDPKISQERKHNLKAL